MPNHSPLNDGIFEVEKFGDSVLVFAVHFFCDPEMDKITHEVNLKKFTKKGKCGKGKNIIFLDWIESNF